VVVEALGDGEEVSRAVDRGSGSEEQAVRTSAARAAAAVATVRAEGWRGLNLT